MIFIIDSGSTKCDWIAIDTETGEPIFEKQRTKGLNPAIISDTDAFNVIKANDLIYSNKLNVSHVYFYGAGCGTEKPSKMLKEVLESIFLNAEVVVEEDTYAAIYATVGVSHRPAVVCILGTGSNTGYYNGKIIAKNSPGLGYVLGDEGSGAYLGKKVLQYFLYKTFDEELMLCFEKKYNLNRSEILNKIYQEPLPNKYLASFAIFLSEHRGHYMIENIIEDGLNDFFYTHLNKLNESWLHPIHFTGSVAYAFRDVIKQLALVYEMELGKITKSPMEGLIAYHKNNK